MQRWVARAASIAFGTSARLAGSGIRLVVPISMSKVASTSAITRPWWGADMWIVQLVKAPKINDFREGYFPRRFHAKKDAQELASEVIRKGGVAVVVNEKNMRHAIAAKTEMIDVAELNPVFAKGASPLDATRTAMKQGKWYMAFYTFYGSGYGYRSKSIEATSVEDAEQKLYQHLNGLAGQGEIEYVITEEASSFRLYDSRKKVRL
jgi:hypothetical protein